MSLSSGQIGPYTITREIGRGGMGVVYLARDTTLDRDVAIKALPPELAEDADRLVRLEREAKTLAQLNHSNVAGIHGVEEQDGQRYLILEYVEGETLAERLDRGALPVDEALEVAIEIAAGVEAAHEAGIIHRDLKPDNIKITPDGNVKVLDFGLARSTDGQSGSSVADAATVTSPTPRSPTNPGAILGTAPYMSPEQARGRRLDKRTDIWSFGVVLYEMLIGVSPFVGETVSDSIGAILHKDIELERLPAGTPVSVHRVLERCLQRDRNLRLRDIGDARLELMVAPRGDEATPVNSGQRGVAFTVAAIIITALITLGIGYGTGQRWWRDAAADNAAPLPEPIHFEFPIGALAENNTPSQFSISPVDRMIVAWIGRAIDDPDDAPSVICVHNLRTGITRRLDGTEHAKFMTMSPDGQQIAFYWQDPDSRFQEYRRVGIDGGPVVRIVAMGNNVNYSDEGFVWTTADEILFAAGGPLALHAVSVNTGTRRSLGEITGMGEVFVVGAPVLGPDDTLFVAGMEPLGPSSFVIDLRTLEATRLVRDAGSVYPIAPDRIAFTQDDTIFVAPYDNATKSITGSSQPVMDGLTSGVSFAISTTGDLLAVRGEMQDYDQRQIYAMDRTGVGEPLLAIKGDFTANVVVSPDGATIAANMFEPTSGGGVGGRVIDRATGAIRGIKVSDEPVVVVETFAPDGRLVVLRLINANYYELTLVDLGGNQEPFSVLPESDARGGQRGFAMTPDGRYVLFDYVPLDGEREDGIYMVDISAPETERRAVPIVVTTATESAASLSPDGKWIAYATDASGRAQIVVQAFDSEHPEARVQAIRVSADGGEHVNWSRDGSELFFLTPQNDFVSAAVTIENDQITVASPEVVLTKEQTRMYRRFGYYTINEMPGEDRFVFIRAPETAAAAPRYEYIMNWTSTLEPAASSESNGGTNP